MKAAFYILLLFSFLGQVAAETCVEKTEPVDGKPHTYETCDAIVEELFRQDIDGFRHTAYAVQYRGARVIVDDPINTTDHAVGEHVTFLVMRTDISAGSIRTLAFMVLNGPSGKTTNARDA